MIPAHANLYEKLTVQEAVILRRHLVARDMLLPVEDESTVTGAGLGWECRHLSHAEVILSIASQPGPVYCDIMDKLLSRPMYMAARGESAQPMLDTRGDAIPVPIGHRRGERPLPGRGVPKKVAELLAKQRSQRRHDNRIIVGVSPNPKMFGTAAHRRYALYIEGMSIQEFLRAGGTMADVRHDEERGFIRVVLPRRPPG